MRCRSLGRRRCSRWLAGMAGACGRRPPGARVRQAAVGLPNGWCHRSDRVFSVAFAVGVHDGALRHAVLRYKYRREMWWADVFARLFADHLYLHSSWFEEFELLVPTPSYRGALGPSQLGSGRRDRLAAESACRPAVGDGLRGGLQAAGDSSDAGSLGGGPPAHRLRALAAVAACRRAATGGRRPDSRSRRRTHRWKHASGSGAGPAPVWRPRGCGAGTGPADLARPADNGVQEP